MFINARTYDVKLARVAVSAQKTVIEVVAGANRLLALIYASLTQDSSTTSAMRSAEFCRKSAGVTGGSAFTPIPTQPNQGASTFTAKVEATAITAEGTVTDRMIQEGFNILSGWFYRPGSDEYKYLAPSGIGALRLFDVTPAETYAGVATFGELG